MKLIDVDDLIHCKDCKYWILDGGSMVCDRFIDSSLKEDDFCSYGEKREAVRNDGKHGLWVRAKESGFVTPGGDPVWKCGTCGGDGHVCGIETRYHAHRECRSCGSINLYPWEVAQDDSDQNLTR